MLILYTQPRCAAGDALRAQLTAAGRFFVEVNIADDPALRERYAGQVPLLAAGQGQTLAAPDTEDPTMLAQSAVPTAVEEATPMLPPTFPPPTDLEKLLATTGGNMADLTSYHMEFTGGVINESASFEPYLSMVGDLQSKNKSSRFTIHRGSGPTIGESFLMLADKLNANTEVRFVDGTWYESDGADRTWRSPQDSTAAQGLVMFLGWLWTPPGYSPGDGLTFAPGQQLLSLPGFRDGSPRLERLDGMPVHRLVRENISSEETTIGTFADPASFGMSGLRTVTVWISTDPTPTVRQMQITGHQEVVQNANGTAEGVAFSPDGTLLAVIHNTVGGTVVRVWDLRRPDAPVYTLHGDLGYFKSVAFSPDGKLIAAGSYIGAPTGAVYLWEVADLTRPPTKLALPSEVQTVAFRPDSQMLAALARGDGVYLWSPPYGSTPPTLIPQLFWSDADGLAFSPDNHTLALGTLYNGLQLYDIRQPQATPTVLAYNRAEALTFSPDGRRLAAAGDRGDQPLITLWDLHAPPPEVPPVILLSLSLYISN